MGTHTHTHTHAHAHAHTTHTHTRCFSLSNKPTHKHTHTHTNTGPLHTARRHAPHARNPLCPRIRFPQPGRAGWSHGEVKGGHTHSHPLSLTPTRPHAYTHARTHPTQRCAHTHTQTGPLHTACRDTSHARKPVCPRIRFPQLGRAGWSHGEVKGGHTHTHTRTHTHTHTHRHTHTHSRFLCLSNTPIHTHPHEYRAPPHCVP